jgi:hypothetical protein
MSLTKKEVFQSTNTDTGIPLTEVNKDRLVLLCNKFKKINKRLPGSTQTM